MQSRDFIYWLQGFLELSPTTLTLNAEQVNLIRKHLALVFIHEIDPSMGNKEHQKELDKVHNEPKKTFDDFFKEVEKQTEEQRKKDPYYYPWLPSMPRFNC